MTVWKCDHCRAEGKQYTDSWFQLKMPFDRDTETTRRHFCSADCLAAFAKNLFPKRRARQAKP